MKYLNSRTGRSAKTGHFVLTRAHGEKISAVEGMKLSSRMAKILNHGVRQGLSGDERRSLIKEEIRKKK
ncbi:MULTISPECIES: hypothetical protein [unclassified Mesorhizobium]|uniref:hypothetical protein n=1 Tax=unclassified Mesorhizobium TaxID=325217 RepID=UPI0011285EB3|nr:MULTISPECIES: hypothetical protein [unclassified Mesorhizobium]MBZ9893484.1 hypothetical protein [Mesorhizobium sp. BR1-1-6]MBZ9960561.1 hypothetical protein [Mesorhizobium sp. BR1-1-14]MCA0058370.1 hypothetical protein [Mesorhizobium sp. B261B1A]TPJ66787.1 hypothetical protein FJ443_01415 [Mesorhizobium sp. B2-6-1]TPK41046.1 hypothetical protein FJ867_03830 [Mesorhizobium sp. B2-5-3]